MSWNIISVSGNKAMNFIFQTVLSKKYTVLGVETVYQASAELKRSQADSIVIIDNNNDEEVSSFLQHLETSFSSKDIHIILLSESKDVKLKSAFLKTVFPKPFNPQEVAVYIDSITSKPSVAVFNS